MNIKKTIDFTNLSPETLVEVFKKHQVTFPRSLRVEVLLTLLEPKYIEERNKIEKQKEEAESTMNIKDFIRLNRLVQYNSLSEFQLENDFTYYYDVNLKRSRLNILRKYKNFSFTKGLLEKQKILTLILYDLFVCI